jgi:hypothetical protein
MIDNSENQLKTEVAIPEVSRTETKTVFNLQKSIAKAKMPALKKGLSGLERHEVKISRAVLRGGSGGNVTLLPGNYSVPSRGTNKQPSKNRYPFRCPPFSRCSKVLENIG